MNKNKPYRERMCIAFHQFIPLKQMNDVSNNGMTESDYKKMKLMFSRWKCLPYRSDYDYKAHKQLNRNYAKCRLHYYSITNKANFWLFEKPVWEEMLCCRSAIGLASFGNKKPVIGRINYDELLNNWITRIDFDFEIATVSRIIWQWRLKYELGL